MNFQSPQLIQQQGSLTSLPNPKYLLLQPQQQNQIVTSTPSGQQFLQCFNQLNQTSPFQNTLQIIQIPQTSVVMPPNSHQISLQYNNLQQNQYAQILQSQGCYFQPTQQLALNAYSGFNNQMTSSAQTTFQPYILQKLPSLPQTLVQGHLQNKSSLQQFPQKQIYQPTQQQTFQKSIDQFGQNVQMQQVQNSTKEELKDSNNMRLTISERIYSKFKLSEQTPVEFTYGENIDLISFSTKVHVPNTRLFTLVKYTSTTTGRQSKIFSCDHDGCGKLFRKWHNLFDHLRIHTGEKPFLCPVESCNMEFNQVSNQKKHLEIHRGKPYLKCRECKQFYTKGKILNHYEFHQPYSSHRGQRDMLDGRLDMDQLHLINQ